MLFTDPFKDKSLTSDQATAIIQDSTGFIWIGTVDGLNCFDGYRLQTYQYAISDSTSLVHNLIKTLFVDASGRLWIGTMQGLCIYNEYLDNFQRIAWEQHYAGLESLQINAVNQDNHGSIYVAAGNAIYRYNESSRSFELFFRIDSGIINSFVINDCCHFWMGASDNGGLTHFNATTKETTRFLHSESDPNSLSENNIRALSIMDGKLWIATYGGGINALELETLLFKKYPPSDYYAGYTTYTYVDNHNNLWICDLTGLKMYDQTNDLFYGYYTKENDPKSIKHSAVAIFQDRQDNYWTIHAPGGVGLRIVPKGFSVYSKNPNTYWHTSNNNITAIDFDSQGNWWIGNGYNGIDVFDWQKGMVRSYFSDPSQPYSLGEGAILSIFRDRNNTLWIGTNLGGMQYYVEKENRFYSYTINPDIPHSIACNDIRSITEDNQGNVWFVAHGRGIQKFNKKEKRFTLYNEEKNNLSNNWAFQILFDAKENLWVATAWGLSKLEKNTEKFKSYHYQAFDTQSIPSNIVNCIFEDSKHQIWIGTEGGLVQYVPEMDNFIRYDPGFSSNNIYAILEGDGYLWVSTPKGISRFDGENNAVFNFDEKDGLPEGEFKKRSAAQNNENALFFGALNGLVVFEPNQLKFNTTIPEVLITGLRISNEPVSSYGETSVLKQHIRHTTELILDYNQNNILLEFVSMNLIQTGKNRFRYKMEGLDKNWIDNGNNHTAIYTHLPPGKYTFRVIASNNDQVWNETGAFLNIRVRQPWWFRWWSLSVMGVCLFALIVGIIFLRTATLEKRNKKLARQVEERTAELFSKNVMLEKANTKLVKNQAQIQQQAGELRAQTEELQTIADNLESTNKKLQKINETKDKLFYIIGHDLKNPFNVLLGYTDLLIDSVGHWDNHQIQETLLLLKETSENTYNLLDNLLNWARSQSEELQFYPESLSTKTVIKEVLSDVSLMAQKKELKIVTNPHREYLVFADHNMIRLVCRNLLVNAVKFSNPGGTVYLNVTKYDANKVLFSIKDEGVGIPQEKLETLFDSVGNTSSRGTSGEKGTGLGLALSKQFVARHEGKIWAESESEKGSTFYFTIPLIN